MLARFLAKVFRFAIAARCSWRMLCFLAATTALPASETGPQCEALGVSKRAMEASVQVCEAGLAATYGMSRWSGVCGHTKHGCNGAKLCCGTAKLQTSLVFITTSGATATQESEQEATDKLLELGALNSSDGRFVPDLNPAASEACTSKSAE